MALNFKRDQFEHLQRKAIKRAKLIARMERKLAKLKAKAL